MSGASSAGLDEATASLLLVVGSERVQRYVWQHERCAYWTAAFEILLEKHGPAQAVFQILLFGSCEFLGQTHKLISNFSLIETVAEFAYVLHDSITKRRTSWVTPINVNNFAVVTDFEIAGFTVITRAKENAEF